MPFFRLAKIYVLCYFCYILILRKGDLNLRTHTLFVEGINTDILIVIYIVDN